MKYSLPASPTELIVLATITAMDLIPYLSFGYVLFSIASIIRGVDNWTKGLSGWWFLFSTVEFLFFAYSYYHLRWHPGDKRGKRKEISNEQRRALFGETLHEMEGKSRGEIDQWIRGWFYVAPLWFTSAQGLGFGTRFGQSKRSIAGVIPVQPSAGSTEGNKEESQVKRGNVEELLAGVFFNLSLAQVESTPLLHHSLTSMLHFLEIKRNHRFPSGHDLSLKPLCPGIDETLINSEHRPLVLYVAIGLLEAIFGWTMYFVGFSWVQSRVERQTVGGWYHPGLDDPGAGLICFAYSKLFHRGQVQIPGEHGPAVAHLRGVGEASSGSEKAQLESSTSETTSSTSTSTTTTNKATPIIFIPGLAGPAFLVHLIVALITLDRPILVVHQPHLSLRLWHSEAPTLMEMKEGLKRILIRRGHSVDWISNTTSSVRNESTGIGGGAGRPLVIAHSLGSALAASLTSNTNDNPSAQIDALLLDPISILMCNSHLSRTVYGPHHPADLNLSSSGGANDEAVDMSGGGMSRLVRYYTRSPCVSDHLAREFSAFDSFLSLRPPPATTSSNLDGNSVPGDGRRARGTMTQVMLARDDHLLPVCEIVAHCARNAVPCEVLEGVGHGGWLLSLPCFMRVFEVIRSMSATEANRQPTVQVSVQSDMGAAVAINEACIKQTKTLALSSPIQSSSAMMNMVRSSSRVIFSSPQTYGEPVMNAPQLMRMGRTRSRTLLPSIKDGNSCEPRLMGKVGSAIGTGRSRARTLVSVGEGMGVWS